MKVICFGDSNTFGYDSRSPLGGRYSADCRWVDILAVKTGWTIRNLGLNGREIPVSPPPFPDDTDLLIVMLGTNDLLQGRSPRQAAGRLESFLAALALERKKLLLIAPPPVAPGEWVSDPGLSDLSRSFARYCQDAARQLGIRFVDAGAWDIPLAYDGVHFTEQGHRNFAAGLLGALAPDTAGSLTSPYGEG